MKYLFLDLSDILITVLSPISGHSKRRTPLISGQHFLHQMTISAYFSFQLADSSKKFKKDEIFTSFQLIYFKHFDTLRSERTIGNRPNQ